MEDQSNSISLQDRIALEVVDVFKEHQANNSPKTEIASFKEELDGVLAETQTKVIDVANDVRADRGHRVEPRSVSAVIANLERKRSTPPVQIAPRSARSETLPTTVTSEETPIFSNRQDDDDNSNSSSLDVEAYDEDVAVQRLQQQASPMM